MEYEITNGEFHEDFEEISRKIGAEKLTGERVGVILDGFFKSYGQVKETARKQMSEKLGIEIDYKDIQNVLASASAHFKTHNMDSYLSTFNAQYGRDINAENARIMLGDGNMHFDEMVQNEKSLGEITEVEVEEPEQSPIEEVDEYAGIVFGFNQARYRASSNIQRRSEELRIRSEERKQKADGAKSRKGERKITDLRDLNNLDYQTQKEAKPDMLYMAVLSDNIASSDADDFKQYFMNESVTNNKEFNEIITSRADDNADMFKGRAEQLASIVAGLESGAITQDEANARLQKVEEESAKFTKEGVPDSFMGRHEKSWAQKTDIDQIRNSIMNRLCYGLMDYDDTTTPFGKRREGGEAQILQLLGGDQKKFHRLLALCKRDGNFKPIEISDDEKTELKALLVEMGRQSVIEVQKQKEGKEKTEGAEKNGISINSEVLGKTEEGATKVASQVSASVKEDKGTSESLSEEISISRPVNEETSTFKNESLEEKDNLKHKAARAIRDLALVAEDRLSERQKAQVDALLSDLGVERTFHIKKEDYSNT